ncbi:MAG: alpha/beta hydrolase [Gemmatimonadales bacterium]
MIKRLGFGAVAVTALGYGGAIGYLKVNEAAMVFQPDAYGGRTQVPVADSLGLRIDSTWVASSDGARLATWLVRAADSTGVWVLSCHGNAGNITLLKRQRFYADLVRAGLNVAAFDYRGFGASSDRPLTEAGLHADARAVYDHLRARLGIPAERIVIYGHSLGGGVATRLATQVPSAGLIVEGTFTSVPDVGQARYPWLPIRLLAANRFDNAATIPTLKVPVMVMHAEADQTIPFGHGRRLFELAPEPKRFVRLGGDHDSAWELDRDTYLTAFTEFMGDVDPRGRGVSRPGGI